MKPAHGISRSFPLLTLAMAVPLIAILAFVAYDRYIKDDGATSDGWWTYHSDRFGYELRLPPDWKIIYESESLDQNGEMQTVVISPTPPTSPGTWPVPHIFAAVNFQGGWCESTRNESRDIIVSSVAGTEVSCYWNGAMGQCDPSPQCSDLPWTLLRRFDRNGRKYRVWADTNPGRGASWSTELGHPMDPDARGTDKTIRKILASYRFTGQP